MRAEAGNAASTWQTLSSIYCKEWPSYKSELAQQELLYVNKLFSNVSQTTLLEKADAYTQHEFQVLGSQPYKLDDAMWHTDIRLKQQGGNDYEFCATTFYNDIAIQVGENQDLAKDIKVPWELSRLQHLPVLAHAYSITKENKYKDVFVHHVQHWQKNNSYLKGVNWVCPMEVALRSVSLIIAWSYFKNADISDNFWQQYVALLYDHMIYLEHNWEWYDGRTSNHYLSNLVGYVYLCWFFKSLYDTRKKVTWVVKEIVNEMEKQVFDEGTSYEGSTKYHVLVTELFYHAQQLCAQMEIVLPQQFHKKLARMMEFAQWCTINQHDYITIGDDDSGKVTFAGLSISDTQMHHTVKHYADFGVSFFKDTQWHISLRHHAYDARQPSGHYHNDAGSITLAYDGIPIIIDPGSYLYTPSQYWRNYFRSAQMHSVAHVMSQEPAPFDARLFALALPENSVTCHESDENILQTSHRLYDRYKLMYDRKVICQNNVVEITDNWFSLDTLDEDILVCSNIIFDHEVTLQKDQNYWLIYYHDKPLLRLYSSHDLTLHDVYKAVSYGQLIPAKRLSGVSNIKKRGEFKYNIIKI